MKKIYLTKNKIALIDNEDFELINKSKWCYSESKNGRGYAKSYRNKKIYMHRLILNFPNEIQIDHINGDTLDNRRSNLRLVTQSQNNMNRQKISNKFGYKGVYFYDHNKYYKRKNKFNAKPYVAKVKFNKKTYSLGYFNTPEEAALAYNQKAKELFGQYAYLNKI